MRLIDADKLHDSLKETYDFLQDSYNSVEKDRDKFVLESQIVVLMEAILRLKACLAVDAKPVITGDTSDGYHTFNELYHHRAVLFSVIVKAFPDNAWKAKKHHDGSMFDGMFIVGIETPEGQATYHYDIDPYWDMFRCKEVEFAPEWDGHTPQQAIERIRKLAPVRYGHWIWDNDGECWICSVCGETALNNYRGLSVASSGCPHCRAKMDVVL